MRKAITALGAALMAALTLRWLMRPGEEIDWRDAEVPGRIETVDGVGIHYVERRSGPAVVLIHGFGGHTFSFRYLIPDLARDHRVVAVDLKGFGYSERPQKGDYSLSAQARLVVHLMDALGLEKASLVGHSMGGEVAMRIAAGWPQRVEKLVLAASVSGERIPTLPATPLIKPLLSLFGRMFGRWLFRRMFYNPQNATKEALDAYRAPARIRGSRDATYRVIRDFRRDKRVPFERITAPVLILWAARDRIVPRWGLARLRKRFPRAAVVTIERTGHLLLEEQPEQCNAAIRRFLAGDKVASAVSEGVDIAQTRT